MVRFELLLSISLPGGNLLAGLLLRR